jgi:hypothetical protein
MSTTCDHKNGITGRCSSLVHLVNGAAALNELDFYHYSKDNENKLGANDERFMLDYIRHFFHCCQHDALYKINFPLLFAFSS